eukprot:scaffold38225_cov59-Phaeocystis_antarctica.AAC.2
MAPAQAWAGLKTLGGAAVRSPRRPKVSKKGASGAGVYGRCKWRARGRAHERERGEGERCQRGSRPPL